MQSLHQGYQLSNSFKLLSAVDHLLGPDIDLAQSDDVERFLIAGISDKQTQKRFAFDTQLLGAMNGYASFKKIVKNDPLGLAKLMKIIPHSGPVDGWHFMQFVDAYKDWFVQNGFKQCVLYPATRLLAMKRPDQFIPINETTAPLICEAFSIKVLKKQEFQRYWDELIKTIQKTQWHQMFQPMEAVQIPFHRARVALLERLVVAPLAPDAIELKNTAKDTPVEKESELTNDSTTTAKSPSSPVQTIRDKDAILDKTLASSITKKQPKKMTINQRQSAKVNQNAATKLMSQYYFANKDKFAKVDVKKHRESIVAQLVGGESVEAVFEALLE